MIDLGILAEPEGHLGKPDVSHLDSKLALQWYRAMKLIRSVEETLGDMVATGEVRCPCHLGIGQEAVAVGICTHLRTTDKIFGAHRSHSHYLALGAPVIGLLAEVLGKNSGCARGFGGSMHLMAREYGLVGTVPIVGATIPIAVGAGMAARMDGNQNIAVSFLGDGAAEEGVFHESLNLAKTANSAILFVVENNLYASHLHIGERQPSNSIARFAEAHGVKYSIVDGNDISSVSSESQKLIEYSRVNQAPTLIEAVTYRWRGHVGHREDDDVGVERSGNLSSWKRSDPIGRFVDALVTAGKIEMSEITAIDNEIDATISDALATARRAEFPQTQRTMDIVYHAKDRT